MIAMSAKPLNGQVALVTGAGRGIGRAIALRLADEGMAVGVIGRSPENIEETVSAIKVKGVPSFAAAVDVCDRSALDVAIRALQEELGPLDLLVNNAGSNATFGPTWEVDAEQWWSDISINLFGPFIASQLVLPTMIDRRQGRIVNIASGSGNRPSPNNSAYACSKLALIRLTDSLAAEIKEYGLSVFALSPGAVREGMPSRILQSPRGRQYIGDLIDSLDFVEPSLAADAVVFLASGAGDALTGRFFRSADDLPGLVEHADEIEEGDYYQMRLRVPS
jgi:NAD(P)-dependent dehydrogenase (short-subunit alcohol dehydrogenase family)